MAPNSISIYYKERRVELRIGLSGIGHATGLRLEFCLRAITLSIADEGMNEHNSPTLPSLYHLTFLSFGYNNVCHHELDRRSSFKHTSPKE